MLMTFLEAEYESVVYRVHATLIHLMRDIGIQRSECKSVKLTQVIEFIGNLFDSKNLTIGITLSRKAEILSELEKWHYKNKCTQKQLKSLIGKLQFVWGQSRMTVHVTTPVRDEGQER